jgi:hypothetical protein
VAYISRDDPRTLTERIPVLQHFRHLGPDILEVDPAQAGLTVLNDLGVGFVVLDRYKMPGGLEREYTEQLAAVIFRGQEPLYADERITVYRVPPAAQPVPYPRLGPTGWGILEQVEGVPPYRQIGPQPAQLSLHHAPANTALQIRYRTAPGGGLTISQPDGKVLASLPPAPNGERARIALDAAATIFLTADEPTGARIESIALILP